MLISTGIANEVEHIVRVCGKMNLVKFAYPYRIEANLKKSPKPYILRHNPKFWKHWKIHILILFLSSISVVYRMAKKWESMTTFEKSASIFVLGMTSLVSILIYLHKEYSKDVVTLVNQLISFDIRHVLKDDKSFWKSNLECKFVLLTSKLFRISYISLSGLFTLSIVLKPTVPWSITPPFLLYSMTNVSIPLEIGRQVFIVWGNYVAWRTLFNFDMLASALNILIGNFAMKYLLVVFQR